MPEATGAPAFNNTISWGNVLTLITIASSLAVGWGAISQQASATGAAVAEVKADLLAIEIRVRGLETADARAEERVNSFLNLLNRIDGRLARIERNKI